MKLSKSWWKNSQMTVVDHRGFWTFQLEKDKKEMLNKQTENQNPHVFSMNTGGTLIP
jgi:hypothetical protein